MKESKERKSIQKLSTRINFHRNFQVLYRHKFKRAALYRKTQDTKRKEAFNTNSVVVMMIDNMQDRAQQKVVLNHILPWTLGKLVRNQ
jgi:protein-arginine kinase